MATALIRFVPRIARRNAILGSIRLSSAPAWQDPAEGKQVSKDVSMPDLLGHAVGPERWELLQKVKGNDDPYEMRVQKLPPGTKDKPTLIPSTGDKRIVGCICEEDAVIVKWMYLHKGEPKRCQCGHWFKLTPLEHH